MKSLRSMAMTVLSISIIGGVFFAPTLMPLVTQFASAKVQPTVLVSERETAAISSSVVHGSPRSIRIPSIGIDIEVKDGYFDASTQLWTIDEQSAYYATATYPLNSSDGNTLIYGHNSDRIFGKLPQLSGGAQAILTTDNGHTFTYVYKDSETVKPTSVGVLNYAGSPRIMLQTCTGLWNENRQMFYFYLKDYS